MAWLLPSVIASLGGSVILTLVFTFLYFQYRERHMRTWAWGWFFYTLRFVFVLLSLLGVGAEEAAPFIQLCVLTSGLCLFKGSNEFVGQRPSRFWLVGGVAGAPWIVAAHLGHAPLFWQTLPIFFFYSLISLRTGVIFLRSQGIGGPGKLFTGWGLILWGVHKADYPFLRPVEWFAPWGFLLGVLFGFAVAMGMLLVYFQRVRGSLLDSEERFRAIADYSYDWESWIGPDNRPLWINPAVERITGFTPLECMVMPDYPLALVHGEDRGKVGKIVESALEGSSGSDEAFRIIRKDGGDAWVAISWQPIRRRDGTAQGYRTSVADIRHRKEFEKALKQSMAHYRALVETVPYGIVECDACGQVTYVNSTYCRMQGASSEVLAGKYLWDLVALPEERNRIREKFARVVAEESEPATELTRNIDSDGSTVYRQVDWNYLRDKSGNVSGFIGVVTDITERRKIEEALRQSESNYRDLVEFAPVPMFVCKEGRFVYLNPAAVKLHAAESAEDLLGRRLVDFVHPMDKRAFLQRPEEDLDPGDDRKGEIRIVRLDREVIDLEVTAMNVNYTGEKATLAICIDATERKAMVEELLKSESRYRGIVEDQTEFIVRWLPDGTRTFVNESYCRYFGHSREALIGTSISADMGEGFESLRDEIQRLNLEQPVSTILHRVLRRGDSPGWHHWTNRAIFNHEGKLIEIQSVGQDVSDRKCAEEELQTHTELLRTILDTIPAPIFYKNEKGVYLGCNEAFEKQLGLPRERIIGHTVYDIAPSDLADIYHAADNQLLRRGGTQFYETQVLFADGTRHDVIFNKAVFARADGEAGGMVGAMLDITERKRYEGLVFNLAEGVSAQTGEHFFRSLVKHLANALGADFAFVAELRSDKAKWARTIAVFADGQEADDFEYPLNDTPCGEIVGKETCSFTANVQQRFPRDQLLVETGVEAYVGAPLVDSAGKRLGLLVVLYRRPLEEAQMAETLLQIFAARATAELERQQSQEFLRQSEHKYRRLFQEFQVLLDGISDPLMLLSPELEVIWSNRGAHVAGGGAGSLITGRRCFEIWAGGADPCEGCPGKKSFRSGKEENAQVCAADGTIWDIRSFPIRDESGSVNSIIEMRVDVTERIKRQKENIRTGQLAALGELAAGVAHEINNPITGVINYAQILANMSSSGTREHEVASRIIREGDRIASIVGNLLSFARKNKEEKRPFQLRDILADALDLVKAQMRKDGINIRIAPPVELPAVVVCPQQIQQVFLNVLSNARYALNQKYPGRGEDKILEISSELVEAGTRQFARITFLDHGCGVPRAIMDRIMNPFFTTKPQGEGTGLGLSISHEIVADHGGRINLSSVEGAFTKVVIDLAAAQ